MSAPRGEGMRRLEQAMELYLAAGDSPDPDRLLREHGELSEVLAPLLAPRLGEPEAPARQLGDFELLREIGRGGMGIVYEARQVSLDRRVAVKVLAEAAQLDPVRLARFQREALLAAQLRHPHLLEIHAVGNADGVPYLAMELVDGAPLGSLTLDRRAAVTVTAQVAEALECVHRAGIVHRDVKPSNILVRRDGRAVLTDFGLARDLNAPSLTHSGAFAGTPGYASPEQALGRPVDARSDVFALGATLYELLAQRRPFVAESTPALLQAIATHEPTPLRQLVPEVDADLAAIVARALEKEPVHRYPSAGAMAADLRAWLAGLPVRARLPGPLGRLRRFVRREPVKAALIGVLALGVPVVTGLVGFLVARAPEVARAHELMVQDEVEHLLADGFLEFQEGSAQRAQELFTRALALAPESREAVLGARLVRERIAGRKLPDEPGEPAPTPEAGALEHALAVLRLAGKCDSAGSGDPRFRQALQWISVAVQRAAKPRLLYHTQWAHMAGHLGDPAACEAAARALLGLWPDSLLAWRWGAFALGRAGKPAEALPWARRVLAARPEDPVAAANLVILLAAAGETSEAVQLGRRTVAAHPGLARGHAVLGDALALSGDLSGAMEVYRRAMALDPDDRDLHYNLGWVHFQRDEWPEAIRAFRGALALRPNDPSALFNLASSLEQTGDLRGSLAEWLRIHALAPARADVVDHAERVAR
ncbi:MAG: protein kinase, partial [Planctomycetes bacterium]|nr:protein kinase [Planctomycetota bacterium]